MNLIHNFLLTGRNASFGLLTLIALAIFPAALATADSVIVTGPGGGHTPEVNKITIDARGGNDMISFLAYNKHFAGGVRVAAGDVNGDGFADIITGPGPGMKSEVQIFDGQRRRRMHGLLGHFHAYQGNFRGGLYVGSGDVNGDGRDDIIVGPGQDAPPVVRVFEGGSKNLLHNFLAYASSFNGGVRVAAGDVNGDGFADIITGAGPGAGPHVKVFSPMGPTELRSFFAYQTSFNGGVFVAAGDVTGDGHADIITGAGPGAGPHVKVFDGATNQTLQSFFAFDPSFMGGVRVAAGDVNNDGLADIIVGAGPGGGPHVKAFDGRTMQELHSFFAYEPSFMGGVFVGAYSKAGMPTPQGRSREITSEAVDSAAPSESN